MKLIKKDTHTIRDSNDECERDGMTQIREGEEREGGTENESYRQVQVQTK